MRVYLVGLPGSGKTTFGQELAIELAMQFIDLDHEIVEQTGKQITDIFAQYGEEYFRKLESEIVKESVQFDNSIISTGGGAPCFFDNMAYMNGHGLTIFLDVEVKEIVKRMSAGQVAGRPLFKGKTNSEEVLEELSQLRTNRLKYYEQASIHLSGDQLELAHAISFIKNRILL